MRSITPRVRARDSRTKPDQTWLESGSSGLDLTPLRVWLKETAPFSAFLDFIGRRGLRMKATYVDPVLDRMLHTKTKKINIIYKSHEGEVGGRQKRVEEIGGGLFQNRIINLPGKDGAKDILHCD